MYDIISWLYLHWDEVVLIVTGISTAASLITAATPTPKDDEMLRKLRTVLNKLALNVGHARNAESVGADPNAPAKPVP